MQFSSRDDHKSFFYRDFIPFPSLFLFTEMSPKKSRLDLDPSKWGRPAWSFILSAVEAHPDNPTNEEINQMRKFTDSLESILPCSKCRKSYSRFKQKNPVTRSILRDRESLRQWFQTYKEQTKQPKKISPASKKPTTGKKQT